MTTSAVPVVCAAGALDRVAVDELRAMLLARLRHCVEGAALICDLSQARVFEPAVLTRMLADTAVRAAGHQVGLFVLPCPGVRRPSTRRGTATVAGSGAVGTFALLDDIDSAVRRTSDPELQRDDRQVRRILERTIRHCLRDLRGQPPHDSLDPATRQALRWRLTDAAHAGVGVGPRLLAVAAGVRRALTSLNARQHKDAYFALLDAEDLLAGRADPVAPEPTSPEPISAAPPGTDVPPTVPAPRAASTRGQRAGSRRGRRVPVIRQPAPVVTQLAGSR